MKTVYSLLLATCLLAYGQCVYANHEKSAAKNFHFGPVPNATDGEGDKDDHIDDEPR